MSARFDELLPMGSETARDQAILYPVPALDGAVVLNASYRQQRFAPHSHGAYAIGLVTAGAFGFRCQHRYWVAPTGSISLVNPGEVHTGEARAREGWRYWNAYIPADFFTEVAGQVSRRVSAVGFPSCVAEDAPARAALGSFFASVQKRAEPLAQQALLLDALAILIDRFVGLGHSVSRDAEPRMMAVARDYMAARFDQPIRLAEVAAVVGVTGFHLTRLFKATTGLALHGWLIQYRVERAREMLLRGAAIAETAATCGFSDQPHLTRWLRRMMGVTPGQIQAMSRSFKT